MKAIVFEGGGVLAAAQAEIIHALSTRKAINLEEYSIFVGTSAGAINALALAIRMDTSDIVKLWQTTKKEDIMPRSWWKVFGKHENRLDMFVRERILPSKHIPPTHTMQDLYAEDKTEFYTVATCLQNNKGVIFGHDWHNVDLGTAVKFTTSHPMKFNPNEYVHNGITYDLSDGGLIQNCPVAVIANRTDLEEVLCISVSDRGRSVSRIKGWYDVLSSIVSGMVSRNEYMSYAFAESIWRERFKLIRCLVDARDIFDVDNIPSIMSQAQFFSSPCGNTIESWIPKSIADYQNLVFNSFM